MKEVNLFTYCGSSQMKEKLWRDMFIAHIFGVDMPGDIEVRRLSDSIKNGISGKEFSPALASLLILYGGGYIDDDAFIRIMPDCENYSDEIAEVEKILVEQGNEEGEDRYNGIINGIATKLKESGKTEIVMLSGPSSAGKTTTAKRLKESLEALGVGSIAVSLDDFYLNNCDAPRFPDGTPDFETVYALDIPFFKSTMNEMLSCGKGHLPEFDFVSGKRKEQLKEVSVKDSDVIIVEGLHALNPLITAGLPKERLFKIYINVSSRIYDEKGDIVLNKRNMRFIRRIVRDSNFRGNSVEKTFGMWLNVCHGEDIYLFPYRDNADIKINTVHLYETCLLKNDAERLLSQVEKSSPFYRDSQRLLKSLCRFPSIDSELVPETSLLREFIGYKEEHDATGE